VTRRRLQYQQDRIDLTLARQRHAREAAPDCKCWMCVTTAELEAEFRAKIKAQEAANPPIPF
jgi:hypothetical protein